ncbi:MAG: histidine phosphatase family protein [Methylotenera sp.]
MANLILWRHAEAEDSSSSGLDVDRALTKRGQKDAKKMANWLHQHLPSNVEILCSPAKRCVQTATALYNLNPLEIKVVDFLSAESTLARITKEIINDDSSKTLLIIGHQPNLGLIITKLLGMHESACAVKKGAIWWLRQREVNGVLQTYLFTVQHPEY